MRKIALLLAVVLLLAVPLSVQAATPRAIPIRSNISYSGNIATSTVQIVGSSGADYLEATIKLWRGSSCIATWNESGTGRISFSETATVTQGKTHKLTVDCWVNGVAQEQVSITK